MRPFFDQITLFREPFALRGGRPFGLRLEGRALRKLPAGGCFETAARKMRRPSHERRVEGQNTTNLQIRRTPSDDAGANAAALRLQTDRTTRDRIPAETRRQPIERLIQCRPPSRLIVREKSQL